MLGSGGFGDGSPDTIDVEAVPGEQLTIAKGVAQVEMGDVGFPGKTAGQAVLLLFESNRQAGEKSAIFQTDFDIFRDEVIKISQRELGDLRLRVKFQRTVGCRSGCGNGAFFPDFHRQFKGTFL